MIGDAEAGKKKERKKERKKDNPSSGGGAETMLPPWSDNQSFQKDQRPPLSELTSGAGRLCASRLRGPLGTVTGANEEVKCSFQQF